jgi:hypothetical protein
MKFDKYYTPPGRYCYFRSFLRNTYWEENPVKAVIATSFYIEAVPGLFFTWIFNVPGPLDARSWLMHVLKLKIYALCATSD